MLHCKLKAVNLKVRHKAQLKCRFLVLIVTFFLARNAENNINKPAWRQVIASCVCIYLFILS